MTKNSSVAEVTFKNKFEMGSGPVCPKNKRTNFEKESALVKRLLTFSLLTILPGCS